jgi:hypothetical protein
MIYRYLYYNLFRIWSIKKDERMNARINAIITMTFLLFVNILSIPLVLMAIFRKEIIPLSNLEHIGSIWLLILMIITGILIYIVIARKKQHDKIIQEFNNETIKQRKSGILMTVAYLVISFGIPLYIIFFTNPLIN